MVEPLRVQLPREPKCAALARRLVEAHLTRLDAQELADVKTVVSELVNNALVHGVGTIELRLAQRPRRVLVEVMDEGNNASVRSHSADLPHGLDIVDALSLAWGTRTGSTRVWAELRDSRATVR